MASSRSGQWSDTTAECSCFCLGHRVASSDVGDIGHEIVSRPATSNTKTFLSFRTQRDWLPAATAPRLSLPRRFPLWPSRLPLHALGWGTHVAGPRLPSLPGLTLCLPILLYSPRLVTPPCHLPESCVLWLLLTLCLPPGTLGGRKWFAG